MPKHDKLTPKQEAFIKEYLISLNGADAARKAGYKGNPSTLSAIAAENLEKPLIKAKLQKEQAVIEQKYEITKDRVLRELSAIAFGNLFDLFDWDADAAQFVPKKNLSRDQAAFIESIHVSERYEEVPNPDYGKLDENGEPDERKTIWKLMKKYKIGTLAKEKVNALKAISEMLGYNSGSSKEDEEKQDALNQALAELDAEAQAAKSKGR